MLSTLSSSPSATWERGVASSPRANENPTIELRRDGHLVLLDVARDLVRLFLPALLGDRLNVLELERVRVDPFLEALDLVDGEPVVSDEEVAHGDVQVTLALGGAVVVRARESAARQSDIGMAQIRANLQAFQRILHQNASLIEVKTPPRHLVSTKEKVTTRAEEG